MLYWLTSNVFSMFQQYFTVGLGLLGGDLLRFTGRDLQPPWAHLPGAAAPVAALVADSGNGRTNSNSNHTRWQNTWPAPRARPAPRDGRDQAAGQGEETWQALRPPVPP